MACMVPYRQAGNNNIAFHTTKLTKLLHLPDNVVHTIYDNIKMSLSGRNRNYTIVVD